MTKEKPNLFEPTLKVNLRHKLNVAYLNLRSVLPPKNQNVKVVIYGQGRSGSTLLESLISSSGYFEEQGEIIRPYRRILGSPLAFVKGFANHYYKENFIFHVKDYQLSDEGLELIDPREFLHKLYKEGWKIVYLNRKNILRQSISKQIANQRNLFHQHNDQNIEKSYQIDLEELEYEIQLRMDYLKKERENLEGLKYEEVCYEEDLLDPRMHQKTINRLLDHFGLGPKKVSTSLKRTGKKPLEKQIKNYAEMVSFLKEKGWDYYLNDPSYQ
ncbi:hypothetical protein [Algoriphagus sediminis]|uniref:Sulfotransferase domain-containing protein n=1 Tax=Algoriphagus sediminis TaxID=3057113 RepID=A0ABT7YDX2_9BACT|nr:hypothetical protein [Algoriphagus sediminis]MDN3204709.1 hypothetical protein [Algoriphagus sediminis]